jgi:hypothetical protein
MVRKNQTNHGLVRSTASSWRLEAVGTIITSARLNEYITADPSFEFVFVMQQAHKPSKSSV